MEINNTTPIAMLTVGQLKEVLNDVKIESTVINTTNSDRKFVYGIAGIALLFNCSVPTTNRIKKSGRIDKAKRK